MRRSEAPACNELWAEPSVGLTVLTILSVTILSEDFLAINLNGGGGGCR